MVVIIVPQRTPLRRIGGERDRGRASESLWSRKACPLSYVIPRGARKQKDWEEGEEYMEQAGERRKKLERKLSCELPCSQRNGGLQMEREENWIEDSCRGLRMEIDSWISGKKAIGGWGLGYLMDMKKMRREKKGVVGQRKMTEVD